MGRLLNVFEELRLSRTWVTEEEDVNVAAYPMLAVDILRDSTKEREGDGCLDIFVSVNGWSNRLDESLADPLVTTQCPDGLGVLFRESKRCE
jgi:hypothetical protein